LDPLGARSARPPNLARWPGNFGQNDPVENDVL